VDRSGSAEQSADGGRLRRRRGSAYRNGYTAVEIGFVSGFWLDYDTAPLLGEALRARDLTLSVHAPLAAFMGHVDRGKKFKMALGMLDHTAGLAKAAGAEVIVFHPASCSAASASRRSPTSSTSSATSASGWRRRTGSFRSASR